MTVLNTWGIFAEYRYFWPTGYEKGYGSDSETIEFGQYHGIFAGTSFIL
jgi:hypothetical protein